MQKTFGWIGIVGILCSGAFLLLRQHERRLELNREIVALRQQNDHVAQLQQAHQQLTAAEPPAAELERLRADHAAISRLRAEIDGLNARITAAQQESATERFEVGSKVPAADWKNAGNATSRATLETILWAAAGGDITTFAQHLLVPEGPARQQAITLLESLPAALRAQYGTPERLVAFLAVKDVPFGAAEVIAWDAIQAPPSTVQVQVQLSAGDGVTKDLLLRFSPQGAGWKLVVPGTAIGRYSRMLKAHVAGAGGTK